MVNVALGQSGLAVCVNGDRNGDGAIVIAELVRAVEHALTRCEGDIEPKPYKHTIDHPSDPYLAFPATEGGPSWSSSRFASGSRRSSTFRTLGRSLCTKLSSRRRFEPYIGWTPAEIDAVSLHAEGQELGFGAVLYSPTDPSEVAIQLVRQDAYSVDRPSATSTRHAPRSMRRRACPSSTSRPSNSRRAQRRTAKASPRRALFSDRRRAGSTAMSATPSAGRTGTSCTLPARTSPMPMQRHARARRHPPRRRARRDPVCRRRAVAGPVDAELARRRTRRRLGHSIRLPVATRAR